MKKTITIACYAASLSAFAQPFFSNYTDLLKDFQQQSIQQFNGASQALSAPQSIEAVAAVNALLNDPELAPHLDEFVYLRNLPNRISQFGLAIEAFLAVNPNSNEAANALTRPNQALKQIYSLSPTVRLAYPISSDAAAKLNNHIEKIRTAISLLYARTLVLQSAIIELNQQVAEQRTANNNNNLNNQDTITDDADTMTSDDDDINAETFLNDDNNSRTNITTDSSRVSATAFITWGKNTQSH